MLVSEALQALQNLTGKPIKKAEVARILNLTAGGFQNRVARGSELKISEAEELEKYYNISLLSGGAVNCNDNLTVDYYPEVFGSCGNGHFVLSEQKELIQVPKKLFKHFSKSKYYSVIPAIGDSMNPSIQSGDKLIVEHWSGEQIKDNQIYVFCYKDEIFVKRLIKNVDEIIIKSDNPDNMYRPRFIEKDDMNNIVIIGEIIGLMRDLRL